MSDAAAPWSDAHEPVGEPTGSESVAGPVAPVERVEHADAVVAPPEAAAPEEAVGATAATLDLDLVERDLADVELALARLDAGTYWTDEVTGAAIPDELLAAQPTARRAVSP